MTEITKDTSGLITQVKRNGIAVAVEIMKERARPCLCIRFDGDPGVYKVASFDNTMKAQWFQDIMEEFFREVEPTKPEPPPPPRQPGYVFDEHVDALARKRMDEVLKRIGRECSDEEKAFILWDEECCPPGDIECEGEDACAYGKAGYKPYCRKCWLEYFRKEAEADAAG